MKCPKCNGTKKELYSRIDDIMGWTDIYTTCTACKGSGEVIIDSDKNGIDRYISIPQKQEGKMKEITVNTTVGELIPEGEYCGKCKNDVGGYCEKYKDFMKYDRNYPLKGYIKCEACPKPPVEEGK